MMKKMKRISAILLAALMVLALTSGCVSQYVDKDTTEAPVQTTKAPEQTTKAPEPGTTEAGTTEAPVQTTEADISGQKLVVWYAVSGASGELFNSLSRRPKSARPC